MRVGFELADQRACVRVDDQKSHDEAAACSVHLRESVGQ